MLIEARPVIPRSKTSKTEKTINVGSAIAAISTPNKKLTKTYKLLVTGVPVNIHRYVALMYERLILERVDLYTTVTI